MIGKYNVDVNRITTVNPKGFYTVYGKYFRHDDSSIYDIIFRCKDIIRACEVILPYLEQFRNAAHNSINGSSTSNYISYCEGVAKAYTYILNVRLHAEKILKQAEAAERYA